MLTYTGRCVKQVGNRGGRNDSSTLIHIEFDHVHSGKPDILAQYALFSQ